MSIITIPTKVQRYAVDFKGRRLFFNTTSKESALSMARYKLLGEPVAEGKERDADLASVEVFGKKAIASVSLRW